MGGHSRERAQLRRGGRRGGGSGERMTSVSKLILDHRSENLTPASDTGGQSYYDNLYRLSCVPVAARHPCQFVSMTTANI